MLVTLTTAHKPSVYNNLVTAAAKNTGFLDQPALSDTVRTAAEKQDFLASLYRLFQDYINYLYLSRHELESLRYDFGTHYMTVATPHDPDWAADLVIRWTDFKEAVLSDLLPSERARLALKFIHRFEGNSWYLSVERLVMDWKPYDPQQGQSYNLLPPANQAANDLFSIRRNSLDTLVKVPPKRDASGNYYDPAYFAEVKTDTEPTLTLGVHAQSVVFTWEEISRLQERNNNSGQRAEADFSIVFRSISYDHGETPDANETLVRWPHALALFMRYYQNDCLNNDATILINKAGDLGGICPPRCNDIRWLFS